MPKKPTPSKWEDTKKAKVQADKMSAEIAAKLGFNAPKTKVSPTPKPKPTLSAQQKQEKALAELMKKRAAESKKTGSWPNYYTN